MSVRTAGKVLLPREPPLAARPVPFSAKRAKFGPRGAVRFTNLLEWETPILALRSPRLLPLMALDLEWRLRAKLTRRYLLSGLSLIHISEPTRQAEISYAVFCLKK